MESIGTRIARGDFGPLGIAYTGAGNALGECCGAVIDTPSGAVDTLPDHDPRCPHRAERDPGGCRACGFPAARIVSCETAETAAENEVVFERLRREMAQRYP